MINLLPDAYKKDLRSARMNVALLRYNAFVVIAIAVLIVFWGMFSVMLTVAKNDATENNKKNIENARAFEKTQKEWTDYKSNLAFAKQIIDSQVSYTDAVTSITKLMPAGTVLDSLNLSSQDFGNQITFSAHAKSRDAALKIKESFEKSDFFSNVFFQNITEGDGSNKDYPVSVNISAKINKVDK